MRKKIQFTHVEDNREEQDNVAGTERAGREALDSVYAGLDNDNDVRHDADDDVRRGVVIIETVCKKQAG